jgi:hypothetical protein
VANQELAYPRPTIVRKQMTGSVNCAHVMPSGLKAQGFELLIEHIGNLFDSRMIHRTAINIDHLLEERYRRRFLLPGDFSQAGLDRRQFS